MLHRATSTLSRLALIGLALLALILSTLIWLYEIARSWLDLRRAARAYEITPEKPSDTTTLSPQEVAVTESATSASD